MTGRKNKEDLDVSCHRVAVKEIGGEEVPSHDLLLRRSLKRSSLQKQSRECSSEFSMK